MEREREKGAREKGAKEKERCIYTRAQRDMSTYFYACLYMCTSTYTHTSSTYIVQVYLSRHECRCAYVISAYAMYAKYKKLRTTNCI